MQRGKDYWFNASDAVKEKLADEVFEVVIKKTPPKNKNAKDAWQFYNLQIQNSINLNAMEPLSQIISFYKLNENATPHDILASMQSRANETRDLKAENDKLKTQNTEFQNQLQKSQKQKVKDLVDVAIKYNRVTEEQRANYVSLAVVKAARLLLNKQNVPEDDRYLIIDSDMYDQFMDELNISTYREAAQNMDLPKVVIGNIYGFHLMERTTVATANNAGIPVSQTPGIATTINDNKES